MENQNDPERLIFKLLHMLKRQTDKAAIEHVGALMPGDFNITFMPYFMNIGMEGITNHDLVDKIKVTKQGVSKTVKELERLGLVFTDKNENDARSIMIHLTPEGKIFYTAIGQMANEMTEKYIKLVGAKKYKDFIDTIITITEFHTEHNNS